MPRPVQWKLLAIGLALALGCVGPRHAPHLQSVYGEAAQQSDLERNPIIVIPGILGSRLVEQNTDSMVWGAFLGNFADPALPDGARAISLPMAEGVPLDRLRDDVVPVGVLDSFRVRIFGLPFEQQAYVNILQNLGVGGYRDQELGESGALDYGDDHFTCFQFAYDWRRDNAENAARLHAFIVEMRAYVKKELELRYGVVRDDIRFDIVAHSMGGLLARYFLRYGDAPLPADGGPPELTWAGAPYVDKLILVGTPNAGSLDALHDLVEGRRTGPLLPRYPPAILGTMPSVYQLLPRTRHGAVLNEDGVAVDLFDPEVWIERGWGLAAPDADTMLETILPGTGSADARRAIAHDHLRKSLARARQFTMALDGRAQIPADGPTLHLFAGDAEPTSATLRVSPSAAPEVSDWRPGDGVVLRTSAVMDERVGRPRETRLRSPIDWASTFFLFTDHLGMTRDPAFTDNLLYMLLERPR